MKADNMKRKPGFISHQVKDIYYIVPIESASKNNHCFIRCNETAFSVWEWLEKDKTEIELVQSMQKRYSIDQSQAEEDVQMILQALRAKHLLEETRLDH